MPVCSALNCKSRQCAASKGKISFHRYPNLYLTYVQYLKYHRFPVSSPLRRKWLNNMRRKDWSPNRNAVLCSKHFSDDCYDNGVRLTKGSVPTLFKFEGFEQVIIG